MFLFDKRLERFERITPESVEIGAYIFDTGGVQLVDPPVSALPVKDQVGFLKHAQMLGDGWSADGKALGDLMDCGGAFGQTLKNR